MGVKQSFVIMGQAGGAMVLGQLQVPGRPSIWMIVGQGPIAFAVGASGGCLDIFILLYLFCPLSPSLWETARYRLKYCLKGPLNPKQPTNHLPKTVCVLNELILPYTRRPRRENKTKSVCLYQCGKALISLKTLHSDKENNQMFEQLPRLGQGFG